MAKQDNLDPQTRDLVRFAAAIAQGYEPELRDRVGPRGPGFGSVRVTATVGSSTWDTSVFPDKATGSFVLPVKKEVRGANDLLAGDAVEVQLRVQASVQPGR